MIQLINKTLRMQRAIDSINEKILVAVKRRSSNTVASNTLPRLVAVSKLKPISSIIEAYECGQRYFGENYIQELEIKSNSPEILTQCPDIKFHFIGHLQSNKVKKLLKVKNLHMIESVDSMKLADLIDKAIERQLNGDDASSCSSDQQPTRVQFASDDDVQRLKVLIQVNTSGEEQKNGVQPTEVPQLAEHIITRCKWLNLSGLMTVGKFGGWDDVGPNKDFTRLYELRNIIANQLALEPNELELSMGMSNNFEEAIELGSTNVRVGTMIFGERPPKSHDPHMN